MSNVWAAKICVVILTACNFAICSYHGYLIVKSTLKYPWFGVYYFMFKLLQDVLKYTFALSQNGACSESNK